MDKARTLMEMTNPEAEKILGETALAIIPLGSVEQHGAHLPLGTDYYAAESFARRVAAITGGLLVDFCPFGVTPLHMGFGGTVSLRSDTMIRLMRDVVASLHQHGARKVVFLNWHERNLPAMEIAAEDAQNAHEGLRILIVHAHFIAKNLYGGEVGLTHGGELEVLPVLADRPELTRIWNSPRTHPPWTTGPRATPPGATRRSTTSPGTCARCTNRAGTASSRTPRPSAWPR